MIFSKLDTLYIIIKTKGAFEMPQFEGKIVVSLITKIIESENLTAEDKLELISESLEPFKEASEKK